MQQDEWMRFNAPPVGDHIQFDTAAPTPYATGVPPTGPLPPPMSMGHMISMQNDPRFFNNGRSPVVFGQGMAPSHRAHFDVPAPSPRAAVAFGGRTVAPPPTPLSPRQSDRAALSKPKAAIPATTNISCMNTLFGGQVQPQNSNFSGSMACNEVDPPTNPDFDIKLPSRYTMDHFAVGVATKKPVDPSNGTSKFSNPMQIFHCNGVRGPPKKFDYSLKPKLPECHVNNDVFYDAVEEENLDGTNSPGSPEEVLSLHDSFDDKTYLMDVVDPSSAVLPPRKKKSTPKTKVTRKKTKSKKAQENTFLPETILEEREPQTTSFSQYFESRDPEPITSRDSIETFRNMTDSPVMKEPVAPHKVQKKLDVIPFPALLEEMLEPEIESEDSKDAMYASVTHRRKPEPINISQQRNVPAGIRSPTDVVQKIGSRIIIPSPETIPPYEEVMDSPVVKASARATAPRETTRSRSSKPSSRSKSKSRRSKSVVKRTKDINFTATDQAALAESIRQICLEATPELNKEEFPSFDEPTSREQPGRDSPASQTTTSSGGENQQEEANKEKKKKKKSKKEKSKHSSSVKRSSSRKPKVTQPFDFKGDMQQNEDPVFSKRLQRLQRECKAWHVAEQY